MEWYQDTSDSDNDVISLSVEGSLDVLQGEWRDWFFFRRLGNARVTEMDVLLDVGSDGSR